MSRSCCTNALESDVPSPAEQASPKFYAREDALAALVTFLLSGALYFYGMSPSVTLQDSGELVTAAYHFGVPHPSGYPLWTLLAWLWRHLVPCGNPAWQICTFSVFCGALTAALVTLLAKRSTLLVLQAIRWRTPLPPPVTRVLELCSGISAGLLFACNRSVWHWACVPERLGLTTLLHLLTLSLFFHWLLHPKRTRWLLLSILLCGLAFANDNRASYFIPTMLLLVTFAMGTNRISTRPKASWHPRTWMPALHDFWTLLCATLLATGALHLFVACSYGWPSFHWGYSSDLNVAMVALIAGLILLLVLGWLRWLSWRLAVALVAVFLLALLVYFYLPLAASTHPPMNWGYTASYDGFLHHITRGSYSRPTLFEWLSWPHLLNLIEVLGQQYTVALSLLGLAGVLGLGVTWRFMAAQGRHVLFFVWGALLATGLGLMFTDCYQFGFQQNEYIYGHFATLMSMSALVIAHACAVLLAWVWTRARTLRSICLVAGCGAMLLAPLAPLHRNWDSCNQHGHDFGYEFGFRMFNPGGGYPPMERDAILFAGTDAGLFTSTYLVFCESQVQAEHRYISPRLDAQLCRTFDRRDVTILAQNSLADGTYMEQIRDHYSVDRPRADQPATLEKFLPWQRAVMRYAWHRLGRDTTYPDHPIVLPNTDEANAAFKKFVEDVQAGHIQPGKVMLDENGRIGEEPVQGVMAINGILAKWIFDRNKGQHTFYYEESYIIPWMYPYLQPAGTIMKLAQLPLPTPQQNPTLWADIQQHDFAYWTQLLRDLNRRPEFRRDHAAQQAFSKLRCAIAGIYEFQHLDAAAEAAYRQAVATCPDNQATVFRLATLLARQKNFAAAVATLRDLYQRDPANAQVREALEEFEALLRKSAEKSTPTYPAGVSPTNTAPSGLVTPWSADQK